MSQLDFIERKAHAKINLTLAVLGRRADGFHEIESWMAPLAWHDSIRLSKAERYSLMVTGDVPEIPGDDRNLVTKAHAAMCARAGQPLPTRIELEKRIPSGAGLGGGSSDAAAALLGLNELWGLGLTVSELQPIAAGIGSDVPFFLIDSNAIVTGRGERVATVDGWQGWVGLILPPFGTSTAAVYGRFSRPDCPTERGRPWKNPGQTAAGLEQELFNELVPAAFAVEPRLAELHRMIDRFDERRVHMSGSGSTLFAIFDGASEASGWCERAQVFLGERARVISQSVQPRSVRR